MSDNFILYIHCSVNIRVKRCPHLTYIWANIVCRTFAEYISNVWRTFVGGLSYVIQTFYQGHKRWFIIYFINIQFIIYYVCQTVVIISQIQEVECTVLQRRCNQNFEKKFLKKIKKRCWRERQIFKHRMNYSSMYFYFRFM